VTTTGRKELKTDLNVEKVASCPLRTLMCDLEDGPHHLVPLLALVRGVLGVLHLVLELEERVFDVFEAIWGRFAVARRADWWHSGRLAFSLFPASIPSVPVVVLCVQVTCCCS